MIKDAVKDDNVLNDQQWLIYHNTIPNQILYI